jgi:hypothetical protein
MLMKHYSEGELMSEYHQTDLNARIIHKTVLDWENNGGNIEVLLRRNFDRHDEQVARAERERLIDKLQDYVLTFYELSPTHYATQFPIESCVELLKRDK